MAQRSALQSLWRATRDGLVRLNRLLAERGDPNDMVFHAPPANLSQERDTERIMEARRSRTRGERPSAS